MPDYSVPSWLIPPTQAQREALALQKQTQMENAALNRQEMMLRQQQQQQNAAIQQRNLQIQAAQEERLQRAAQRVADQELSRGIGMKAVSEAMQDFHKAYPEATPQQISKFQIKAITDNAPQIFNDPTDYVRFIHDAQASDITFSEQPLRQRVAESTITRNEALTKKTQAELSAGPIRPETITLKDEVTGKPITMIRTGKDTWREARGEGEEISFTTPGGETMTIKRGERAGAATGGLTPGAATAAQTGLQKDLEAVASLNQAIDAATAYPEAFGVQGKVRRLAEQAKGQLSPNTPMETPITDTQQKSAKAFASVANSLKVDSQLNEKELSLLKDIGYTLDIEEAPQTALKKLNNLRDFSYRHAFRKAKLLNQSVSSLIQSMPRTSLGGLFLSGDLSATEVLAESARRGAK